VAGANKADHPFGFDGAGHPLPLESNSTYTSYVFTLPFTFTVVVELLFHN
jgi:hypothetical protein